MLEAMQGKRNPHTLLVEISMEDLQNLKIDLLYDLSWVYSQVV
jgi:hypothetical protein